jgi:hypothetical protein
MRHTRAVLPLLFVCGLLAVTQLKAQDSTNNSPRDQLRQLTTQLQQSPDDQTLREKIINLAETVSPAPVLPEEAGRRMARGVTAFKEAKSASDYKDAVVEFEKAALAAPWYADAYYNLGQARAKAEDYGGASASLKLYLLAAPGAKDAADAKTLMYEMEYKQEKADKERSAAQANAQQQAQSQQLVETFRGTWYSAECGLPGKSFVASITKGCTAAEFGGSNWMSSARGQGPPVSQFEIENDGTVKIVPTVTSMLAGCEGGFVFGIPQGASFSDIRWEFRPNDGPPRQIWSRIGNDGKGLWISCKRPMSGEDATVRYGYVFWSRTPL